MKTENSDQIVAFAPHKRCWGRLQNRCWLALCSRGEAHAREISEVCWDDPPTPSQLYSQRRAARSIGARPVRRVERQWIWRLELGKE